LSWALVLAAPPEELEIVAAELFELRALGVELQEPGMKLMPGTPQLPEGRGRVIAHFEERAAAEEAASVLGAEPPVEIAAQDWSVAWRAHHKIMQVGPRSWVYPPWEKPPRGVAVAIDPGMAFGTGSHPTTSLCLEACDEQLALRPGADLLDVGTGSGVIALLAVKLGAGRVAGTENDAVALKAAREGAALNGIAPGRIEWRLEDPRDVPGQFGIVIANILLNTLEELAEQIAAKVAPGGRLVLSGLLAAQGDAAERAYKWQGLRAAGRKEREGWIRAELDRPL
jgi:ribosomal protein L11 methyltransferase